MIAIDILLDIIATEALEDAGVLEVPDHKHGAPQNYSTLKRDARTPLAKDGHRPDPSIPVLRYELELVRLGDGSLSLEE